VSRRTRGLLVVLAAVAQVSIVHLTRPALFEGVDFLRLHLLNRTYLREALGSGRLPLWNPHVGLGRPFLADIEVGAFYPPTLLGLALGGAGSVALSAVVHALVGLAGMIGLCRYLGMTRALGAVLGLAFLTAAPVAGRLQAGQAPYAHATCYLPLLFLLAARMQDALTLRRIAHLAIALGFQLLCGHPQIAWIAWTGLGAFLVGRGLKRPLGRAASAVARDLAALGLALLAGLGLAGVQLLPFLELVGQGNRSAPSLEFAGAGAMTPAAWISLLVPIDLNRPFPWEANLYAGIVIALAGAAGLARWGDRNVRGLGLAALAGALVASGPLTPVFRVFYAVLPGMSSFHMPSRSAVLVVLVLLVAAGLYLSGGAPAQRWALAWAAAAAVAARAWWTLAGPATSPVRLAWSGLEVLAAAALLLAWRNRGRWGPAGARVIAGLLLAVGVLDLASATGRLKKAYFVGLDLSRGERVIEQALRTAGLYGEAGVPPRVSVPFWIMRDNSGMARGYSTYSGYVALSLDRVWTYIHRALGLTPSHAENTYPSPEIFRRAPFPYRTMNLVLGFDTRTGALVRNPAPDPRVYLVHGVTSVDHWRQALERMVQGHDHFRSALLEGAGSAAPAEGGPGPGDHAQIVRFTPETVVVEATSDGPGWLVLAEAWYPGWRAWVNGAETACVPANVWMRAVAVPAGRSEVVLRFSSRQLPLGAVLSLASAVLLVYAARRG
jgi:hypothetical protein